MKSLESCTYGVIKEEKLVGVQGLVMLDVEDEVVDDLEAIFGREFVRKLLDVHCLGLYLVLGCILIL